MQQLQLVRFNKLEQLKQWCKFTNVQNLIKSSNHTFHFTSWSLQCCHHPHSEKAQCCLWFHWSKSVTEYNASSKQHSRRTHLRSKRLWYENLWIKVASAKVGGALAWTQPSAISEKCSFKVQTGQTQEPALT